MMLRDFLTWTNSILILAEFRVSTQRRTSCASLAVSAQSGVLRGGSVDTPELNSICCCGVWLPLRPFQVPLAAIGTGCVGHASHSRVTGNPRGLARAGCEPGWVVCRMTWLSLELGLLYDLGRERWTDGIYTDFGSTRVHVTTQL